MNSKIEFQLIEALPDGRFIGRNCGADAPVGTVFSYLYRRDFPVCEPGEEIVTPDPVFVCEVSLRLDAVEMYRRQMGAEYRGHVAMLSFSGSGFAAVAQFVSSASKNTYYSLCT